MYKIHKIILIFTSGVRKCKFQKVAFGGSDVFQKLNSFYVLRQTVMVFYIHVMFPDLWMCLYLGVKYIVYILPQMP